MRFIVYIKRDRAYQSYTVETEKTLTLLELLELIKEQDPTLSFRQMCRAGICGTCGVLLNSKPVLACKTMLSESASELKIDPLPNYPQVKDLVVDSRNACLKLPLFTPAKSQLPKNAHECIRCGICDSVCPVLNTGVFAGPMLFVRLNALSEESKPYEVMHPELCTHCMACSRSCPKNVMPESIISQFSPKSFSFDFLSGL
ncbi:MAG: 2Fe-2S iron-sulfur cluster-binding protein [Aquificaceae bacterium]